MQELTNAVAGQLERIAKQLRDGQVTVDQVLFTNEFDRVEDGFLVRYPPSGVHRVQLTYRDTGK